MHRTRWLSLALMVLLVVGCLSPAADAPEGKTGLKVGEKAPAFTLKDQDGTARSLADLTRDRPVALVFFRSARW